jgi:hypothetical protein
MDDRRQGVRAMSNSDRDQRVRPSSTLFVVGCAAAFGGIAGCVVYAVIRLLA